MSEVIVLPRGNRNGSRVPIIPILLLIPIIYMLIGYILPIELQTDLNGQRNGNSLEMTSTITNNSPFFVYGITAQTKVIEDESNEVTFLRTEKVIFLKPYESKSFKYSCELSDKAYTGRLYCRHKTMMPTQQELNNLP